MSREQRGCGAGGTSCHYATHRYTVYAFNYMDMVHACIYQRGGTELPHTHTTIRIAALYMASLISSTYARAVARCHYHTIALHGLVYLYLCMCYWSSSSSVLYRGVL